METTILFVAPIVVAPMASCASLIDPRLLRQGTILNDPQCDKSDAREPRDSQQTEWVYTVTEHNNLGPTMVTFSEDMFGDESSD